MAYNWFILFRTFKCCGPGIELGIQAKNHQHFKYKTIAERE